MATLPPPPEKRCLAVDTCEESRRCVQERNELLPVGEFCWTHYKAAFNPERASALQLVDGRWAFNGQLYTCEPKVRG